ncbi:uncharacterized protein LTR77_003497 [Saxophila tyrrhenica]|uniref:Acetylxylan esterase n=1 Tax=Saxophila tyrrhenica TaxID=1690608 RepID=A0AAV9PDZ1_9PEZI|nr:hypothetical protein LTR77_003497 [Saxophila tyrrhenica]
MLTKTALLSLLAACTASASPIDADLEARQSCPQIHIFGNQIYQKISKMVLTIVKGARETTAPPGYGSAGTVVNLILNAYPGSTAEVLNYPASGSNPTYSQSVATGTQNVCNQVSSYASRCPNSKLVLVGYSQGSEIFDNALCGGGDPNQGLSSTCSIARYNIKAAIFMGDPRFRAGAPYNVGSCAAGGFDARPAGQYCGNFNSAIKSYCDASDPYCCNGNNAQTHQGYGQEYGQAALSFVRSKLG